MKLNSSPVDELGDGACQSGRQFRGKPTILEPQAMSRVHRLPQQLCEQPPPTRHHHTDQVSGDTYQPYTYWIHQLGREGKGGKSGTTEHLLLETNSTSQQKRPAPAIQENPYVTSVRMIPRPPLTSIGLILT